MPAQAAIPAQNGLGQSVVFSPLSPASGDKVPAMYRLEDSAKFPAHRHSVEVSSRPTASRTARIVSVLVKVPYVTVDPDTSEHTLKGTATMKCEYIAPQNVPQSVIDDLATYMAHVSGNDQVLGAVKTGFAAR